MNHKFFNALCAIALCILLCLGCKREILKIDEPNTFAKSQNGQMAISGDLQSINSTIGDSQQDFKEKVSAATAQGRLQLSMHWADLDATGFYFSPNSTMEIFVKQLTGNAQPAIVIGTYNRFDNVNPQVFNLKVGSNLIRPTTSRGGLVWVRFRAAGASSSVRLSFLGGFERAPVFLKNQTTPDEWINMLNTRNQANDVLLIGNNVYQVYSRQNALEMKGQNNNLVLQKADEVVEAQNDYSGLDGSSALHDPTIHRIIMTEANDGAGSAFATDYAVAFLLNEGDFDKAFTPLIGERQGWPALHELGHMHQQDDWTWSEVREATVNLYTMAAQRALGLSPSGMVSDVKGGGKDRWPAVFAWLNNTGVKDFNVMSYMEHRERLMVRLGMFYQLELAFGPSFYKSLHQKVREEKPNNTTDRTKMDYFMLKACKISGKDLRNFFKYWGLLKNSDAVFSQIGTLNLPLPNVAPSSLRD